jgi:hypothetical protein
MEVRNELEEEIKLGFYMENRIIAKLYGHERAGFIATIVAHHDNLREQEANGTLRGSFRGNFFYIKKPQLAEKNSVNIRTLDRWLDEMVNGFQIFDKQLFGNPPKVYLSIKKDRYNLLCAGKLIIPELLSDYQKEVRGLSKKKSKWDNQEYVQMMKNKPNNILKEEIKK